MKKPKRSPALTKKQASRRKRRKDGRTATGQFAPGVSGNPGGRPAKGVIALRLALEDIERESGEAVMPIARKLYQRAMRGDVAALKLYIACRFGFARTVDVTDAADGAAATESTEYRARFVSRETSNGNGHDGTEPAGDTELQ